MATTKKASAKKSSRSRSRKTPKPQYSCETTPPHGPYSFKEGIRLMMSDPDFAEFIHDILCQWSDMKADSAEAKKMQQCIESWIAAPKPKSKNEPAELDDVCLPAGTQKRSFSACTDVTTLIGMAAWVTTDATAKRRKR